MGLLHNWSQSAVLRKQFQSWWRVRARLSMAGIRDLPLLSLPRGHNLKILDLGCGGGVPWLKEFGTITGIDCEPELVAQASRVYDHAIVGSVAAMPFEDEVFDIVLSRDVVAHVDQSTLESMAKETYRVLKPGGLSIQAMECLNENTITRILRQYGCYEKNYVLRTGHTNLQPIEQLLKLFGNGMELQEIHGATVGPGAYVALLEGVSQLSTWHRCVKNIDGVMNCHPIASEFWNMLLTPLMRCPVSKASLVVASFIKAHKLNREKGIRLRPLPTQENELLSDRRG